MRNTLKKTILLMILLLLTVFNFAGGIYAAPVEKSIPIFCYHRVISKPASEYDLTPAQLEAHFQYFKTNGFHPITVAQLLDYQKKPALLPEKPIVLTFDDGTKSHYTEVLPMLKKYGFKATFYIFPNATRGSKKRWLSWDEITEIAKAGMDIGSHALSHPYLTARNKMDEKQYQVWLEKEVTQSKKTLEEKLHIQVKSLAYPFGLYDRNVEATAIKAGYCAMLNINGGTNRLRENPFRLKRRIMVNAMGPKSLASILTQKALDTDNLTPSDGDITSSLPAIRFRVKTPSISAVRVEVFKYGTVLKPNSSGVYQYAIPGKLKPGFYTIVVSAKGSNNQSYLNTWSFFYRP